MASPPASIGGTLRWMRLAAGLDQAQVGEAIDASQGYVSKFEGGSRKIDTARLRGWRTVCLNAARARLDNSKDTLTVRQYEDLQDTVERMAADDFTAHLIRLNEQSATEVVSNEIVFASGMDSRQRELADIDDQAQRLRQFQPLMVPGVLQTYEWARLSMLTSGQPDEVAVAAARARVQRSQRTLRNTARTYHAVIAQNALEITLHGGGPDTRREQLRAVLAAAQLDHITIQVLPRSVPVPRIPVGGFTIYDPRDPDRTPTVLIDADAATIRFGSPDAVAEYERAWQQYTQAALTPQASAEWIADAEQSA